MSEWAARPKTHYGLVDQLSLANDVGLQEHDNRGEQHSQKDNRTPIYFLTVHRYD